MGNFAVCARGRTYEPKCSDCLLPKAAPKEWTKQAFAYCEYLEDWVLPTDDACIDIELRMDVETTPWWK